MWFGRRYEHIWEVEGAVDSSQGAKRVLHEVNKKERKKENKREKKEQTNERRIPCRAVDTARGHVRTNEEKKKMKKKHRIGAVE